MQIAQTLENRCVEPQRIRMQMRTGDQIQEDAGEQQQQECEHEQRRGFRQLVVDQRQPVATETTVDRKGVVWGKRGSGRVDPVGRRIIQKKNKTRQNKKNTTTS